MLTDYSNNAYVTLLQSPATAIAIAKIVLFWSCYGTAPSYLAESICRVADVEGRRHLRSSATASLIVPPVRRSTLGDRSFPVAAPRAWNSLPPVVRSSSSLITFWRELKTFLFHSSTCDSSVYCTAFHYPLDCVKCPCAYPFPMPLKVRG